MLVLCLACVSCLLVFVVAAPPVLVDIGTPKLASALSAQTIQRDASLAYPNATQWGELQAEVLRLRLILSRVAEAANLAEDEFALTVQLADKRYLEFLTKNENKPLSTVGRFALAKHSVDHMTGDAQLMLDIAQRRHRTREFTLSGSPVARAKITSRFGYRLDPHSGIRRFHRGLDLGGVKGSKVLALADGVVTFAGKNGAYGNLVELEHADGYRTRYAHNEFNLVSVGDKVDKAQPIATMGSTGRSTGTHVHVEVHLNGRAIDPLQFVRLGS